MEKGFVYVDRALVNIIDAKLIDYSGTDTRSYRVYKTISGRKLLYKSKTNEWFQWENPREDLKFEMDALRPKKKTVTDKPSYLDVYWLDKEVHRS